MWWHWWTIHNNFSCDCNRRHRNRTFSSLWNCILNGFTCIDFERNVFGARICSTHCTTRHGREKGHTICESHVQSYVRFRLLPLNSFLFFFFVVFCFVCFFGRSVLNTSRWESSVVSIVLKMKETPHFEIQNHIGAIELFLCPCLALACALSMSCPFRNIIADNRLECKSNETFCCCCCWFVFAYFYFYCKKFCSLRFSCRCYFIWNLQRYTNELSDWSASDAESSS